jgi:hypothetical protein
MIENISKIIKYWREVIFIITVIVGWFASNPVKHWLTSEIEQEIILLKQATKEVKKLSCSMLKIQILQAQMMPILAINDQDTIEAEKRRQIEFLKKIAEEYKNISQYCTND